MNEELIIPVNLSKYRITETNRAFSIATGNLVELRTRVGANGYISFTATYDDGRRVPVEFHRIIGITLIPLPKGFNDYSNLEINHKDGNKLNNRRSNLEWVTRKENERHSYVTGLRTNCVRSVCIIPVNGCVFDGLIVHGLSAAARYIGCPTSSLQYHLNHNTNLPFRGYYVDYDSNRVKPKHIGKWKHKTVKEDIV